MYITATCFGFSYRAIFRLRPKKCYIQLAMLYRVRDLVIHVINIYCEVIILNLYYSYYYSTFFTCCCFPYVIFCELYISCVYLLPSYVCLLYYVCIAVLTLDAGLLARSQYPEGPATGHLDTGFSWFPSVYKRMLRSFPSFQVATTCLSCSTPDLNFLVTYLMFVYM